MSTDWCPAAAQTMSCLMNTMSSGQVLFNLNTTVILPSSSGYFNSSDYGASVTSACTRLVYTLNCTTSTVSGLVTNNGVSQRYWACYAPHYTFWATSPGFYYGLGNNMAYSSYVSE